MPWQPPEVAVQAVPASITEFLTTFAIEVPEGTPGRAVRETEAGEAERAHELARQGHLERLWRARPRLR